MKTTLSKPFVNLMSLFFKIVFWFQLLVIVFLIAVNYFSYSQEEGLRFTVRGSLHAVASESTFGEGKLLNEKQQELSTSKYGIRTIESLGGKTIYFINRHRNGFMRIDYTNFSKAFSLKNIVWFLLEVLTLLIWLSITFQLMKLVQALKLKSVFNLKNINRIKVMGWLFILLPFLEFARNVIFFHIAKGHLSISGATLHANYYLFDLSGLIMSRSNSIGSINESIFPGVILGLIVLLIGQVFKKGLELQNENELTI